MYLLNYPPNLCFSLAISCLYMGSWQLILISQSDFHASIYLDSLFLSALMLMSLICSYVITTFTTKPLYVTTTYLRLHKSSNSSHNQFWFWCFFSLLSYELFSFLLIFITVYLLFGSPYIYFVMLSSMMYIIWYMKDNMVNWSLKSHFIFILPTIKKLYLFNGDIELYGFSLLLSYFQWIFLRYFSKRF